MKQRMGRFKVNTRRIIPIVICSIGIGIATGLHVNNGGYNALTASRVGVASMAECAFMFFVVSSDKELESQRKDFGTLYGSVLKVLQIIAVATCLILTMHNFIRYC